MAIQDFTAGQILTAAQMDALQANDYNQTVSNKTANYTLVAADKGTRVVMSNAGSTTITVNSGLFAAGDTLFIQNIGVGTCTITAGTCTVTTASSLALGTWAGGTLYFTSASAAIFFSGGGAVYGAATGGTSSSITVGGIAYTLLTFTSSGTLTVTKSGLFDIFAIGGGAGGGYYSVNGDGRGGGGGAGGGTGLVTAYFTANQTVTVGGKGLSQASGSPSRCGNVFASFGGVGATFAFSYNPVPGGSGGGGMSTGGAAGSAPQGFAGGSGSFGSGVAGSGGGGGYGSVGGSSPSAGNAGNGGTGYDISQFIGGSSTFVMGGGGGGGLYYSGAGGSGVGGTGTFTGAGSNATATAYGSGGGGGQTAGGTGADGVVYVRFRA